MRRLLLVLPLLTALLLAIPTTLLASDERVYTIGIVPQFDTRKLFDIWEPILKQVEEKTGIKFKLVGSPTIPAFEKEFLTGEFDFAYMNPYHILLANESSGYIPLLRDTGRQLHGVLVVNKESGVNSIEDLNGKIFAFPAPNALGASLMIRAELTDVFKIDYKPQYVNTHSSVYLNVALGKAAAGGGVQKTLNQQPEDVKSFLKVIHRTRNVPPHPLVVHPRVPEKVRQAVIDGFMALGALDQGKELLRKVPIKKIGPAFFEEYLPLAELELNRFYQD